MSKQGYERVSEGLCETVNCPVCGQPMETRFEFLDGQRVFTLWCEKDTHTVRVTLKPEGKDLEQESEKEDGRKVS